MREATRTKLEDCPCCGYKEALSVTIKDGKQLYHCHAGCGQSDLWQAISGGRGSNAAPLPTKPPKDTTDVIAYARSLWRQSLPAADTLVVKYLASRGLNATIPPSLRFVPCHWHKPSSIHAPIMLAAVVDIHGTVMAVHRTYLSITGRGKAPVEPAKMTLAPIGGYGVHLAPAAPKMAISEGIETGLAVQFSTGIATWAALSAGNMKALILPPLPLASEVVICADNDPVGLASADAAAARWSAQGRTVRIAKPREVGTDFNDVIMKGDTQ